MKQEFSLNLQFTYDPARKGAMYTLDGTHWMNAGDFCEIAVKAVHGLAPVKDGNTAYDEGCDIPEYSASVKSAKATLTTKPLGNKFDEMVTTYFKNVKATKFWWVVVEKKTVTVYKMDAKTFERFTRRFAKLTSYGVIRFPTTSSMVTAWLNTNNR